MCRKIVDRILKESVIHLKKSKRNRQYYNSQKYELCQTWFDVFIKIRQSSFCSRWAAKNQGGQLPPLSLTPGGPLDTVDPCGITNQSNVRTLLNQIWHIHQNQTGWFLLQVSQVNCHFLNGWFGSSKSEIYLWNFSHC